MIKLTDYDTGEPIYIDPKIVGAVVPLPASDCQQELTSRTRIDHKTSSMIYLVRESLKELEEKGLKLES